MALLDEELAHPSHFSWRASNSRDFQKARLPDLSHFWASSFLLAWFAFIWAHLDGLGEFPYLTPPFLYQRQFNLWFFFALFLTSLILKICPFRLYHEKILMNCVFFKFATYLRQRCFFWRLNRREMSFQFSLLSYQWLSHIYCFCPDEATLWIFRHMLL